MNAADIRSRGTLYFCYAKPDGFSGQKAATELVRDGLAARGWCCRELPQPVLDRGAGLKGLLAYGWQVATNWARATRLLFARDARLWVGLGQTRASFLRDSVPLLLGRIGLGRERLVVSLNGSLFMHWPVPSLDARLFQFIAGQAGTVTVVGARQRARLLQLGVPDGRAAVVVNSCTLAPLTARELEAKLAGDPGAPVRCLFLSSLIDTKGYPEYLEALQQLATSPGRSVEAVLCGRLVVSDFGRRFRDEPSAAAWIEDRMAVINASERFAIRWIKGATGDAKAALFREADIFVLPTYYAVEAQPLVLLEAMASGCAIVTTRIAEIPTLLDETCASFLAEASTDSLAESLRHLMTDATARTRQARAAHARFVAEFGPDRHLDAWERVLRRDTATMESE